MAKFYVYSRLINGIKEASFVPIATAFIMQTKILKVYGGPEGTSKF